MDINDYNELLKKANNIESNHIPVIDDNLIDDDFKVGDKVRLMSHSKATHGFEIGDICVITKIEDCGGSYPIEIRNSTTFGYVGKEDIQKI